MSLERIVYLTETNYDNLISNGTVTANGQTISYSANDLYITPLDLSVASPAASGSATAFITSVSQNASGKITISKANLNTSGDWTGTAGTLKTSHTFKVSLGSTAASTGFNGSADISDIGVSGTLKVANGGTGVSTLTANSILVSGASNTAAITTRTIQNNSTTNATVTANTNIPTMNTVYNALAKINNADQTHAVQIYAPTTGGTAGYILTATGTTTAPIWAEIIPVANGGTGVKTITANSVLMSGSTTTAAITTRAITDQTSAANPSASTNLITVNTLLNYCGTTNISTVGTITSGTWNGNPVDTGFITSSTVAIPAAGNSVTKTLQGLTADYQLVRWNFSSSPENAPPASLTWTTGTNQFTITNNFGTTSQTIKPVFIKPTSKAIS